MEPLFRVVQLGLAPGNSPPNLRWFHVGYSNTPKVLSISPGLALGCRHRTYTESAKLYRKFYSSLYPFHDLGHIAEFEDWVNMAGWHFYRMLLLLELVAYMLAYNDTDQCRVCQISLLQNPRVPWHKLLKKKTRRTILLLHITDIYIESCPIIPSSLLLISRCVLVIHILGLHPASERRRYLVATSLTGWVQA